MTTACPIIRECLKQLRATIHRGLFSDLDVEDLSDEAESISSDPSYVRLRGFMAVEMMLGLLKPIYEKRYRTSLSPDLRLELEGRRWSDLTKAKDELEALSNEVDAELCEAQLEGHIIERDDRGPVVVRGLSTSGEIGAEDEITRGRRLAAAKVIARLVPIVRNAVIVLRPYCGNPESPVSSVGSAVAWSLREVHGDWAGQELYDFTRKLIEVRL